MLQQPQSRLLHPNCGFKEQLAVAAFRFRDKRTLISHASLNRPPTVRDAPQDLELEGFCRFCSCSILENEASVAKDTESPLQTVMKLLSLSGHERSCKKQHHEANLRVIPSHFTITVGLWHC